jgi:hypothetical protein
MRLSIRSEGRLVITNLTDFALRVPLNLMFSILKLLLCFHSLAPATPQWKVEVAWPEWKSFAVGTGLTLTSLAFNTASKDLQRHEARTKPLKDFAKLGDYSGQLIPNALYVFGQGAIWWAGEELGFDRAGLMLVATTEAALITTVLKYSVRQERPDSTQRNSFPSGHTTTAFAFAAVVGEEHGWRWGVPAYALATLVGWSRMNDNKHYLHDVLAGATIGTSVGLGVVRKMRQRQPLNEVRAEVLPMLLSDGGMLMFSRNW